MNVKDYRYVIEIARQESVSQAADVLCITQSALTKFLQRTERELGIALFFRKNNRLYLTEAGRFYVEKGREIVRLDDEMESGIRSIVEDRERSIRVGCSMGREDDMVREVLVPFYRNHPEVHVQVVSGSTFSGLEKVEKNELDLALVTAGDYRPGLNYYPVGEVPLVLGVPADSELAERGQSEQGCPYPVVSLDQWISEPFIQLSSITASGKTAREFFKREGAVPQVRLEVNSVRSGLKAVEAGLGNTIFWGTAKMNRGIACLTLKELQPVPQRMYVAYRANYRLPEIGRELIALIRKTLSL